MRWTSCAFTRKSVIASGLCATKTTEEGGPGEGVCAKAEAMAQKKTAATFRMGKVLAVATDFMSNGANNNCAKAIVTAEAVTCSIKEAAVAAASSRLTDSTSAGTIRHLYVHIPFCARICPYCAFYKDLLDRSQTERFCEAILHELKQLVAAHHVFPSTIYFGGGTPTALNIAQLELLLRGFHEQLDLSQLVEWTMEANPGSVSARKAASLKKFGVNRISLGVQSWDDELLKLLGREHNAQQAEHSFHLLRAADFTNLNIDLMFGLPGQKIG